jgi:prepilin-type N-terminal cleavage/methylation domain-containing protein
MMDQAQGTKFPAAPGNYQSKSPPKIRVTGGDFPCKVSNAKGFTMMELMIVIAIILLLAAIGMHTLFKARSKAMEITIMHDLSSFAKLEQEYFLKNDSFAGNPGESIRNDGKPSDFHLDNFKPSENIIIKILSGDPENPYSDFDPIIAESRYTGNSNVYEYNFNTKKITKR